MSFDFQSNEKQKHNLNLIVGCEIKFSYTFWKFDSKEQMQILVYIITGPLSKDKAKIQNYV